MEFNYLFIYFLFRGNKQNESLCVTVKRSKEGHTKFVGIIFQALVLEMV